MRGDIRDRRWCLGDAWLTREFDVLVMGAEILWVPKISSEAPDLKLM